METKILFKSETSLLSTSVEVREMEGKRYAVIVAEEEQKVWGVKLFPGDDRDCEIQLHPVEIKWEIGDNRLIAALEGVNKLDSPLILFTFEGIKPRVLLGVQVFEKEALKQLEKNVVIFPNNPKEEREKRIEEEEDELLKLGPNIWIHGG